MHENEVEAFDRFFCKEYNYLKGFTKSINPQHHYADTLHDCYLRARNRIAENGFTGTTYLNYFRVTLMNYFKSQYRNKKQHQLIDIENPDYMGLTEQILAMKEEQEEQQKELDITNIYLTSNVYEFLNKYASAKEQFIFRSYFLLHKHHINYKELSRITGYSITSVSNIIKRLKKDLRRSIKCYIINGISMDELLLEVENQLKEPINAGNEEKYKALYKKIWGQDYRGCSCKRQKLANEIINWYNQNR